jgi:signal peptidase I
MARTRFRTQAGQSEEEAARATSEAGAGTGAKPAKRREPVWREYGRSLLVAVVLALIIRTFGFQAFKIPTGSMEDTLLVGDFLFVSKFLYGAEIPFSGGVRLPAIRQPQRGDIIVFRYPENPSEDYIKRCVAVPGDLVEYRDKVLYVNGEAQEEGYTKYADGRRMRDDRDSFAPISVPEGKYFMMGDNRDRSLDSRYWGLLDHSLIRGKALFIYWSWDGSRGAPRFSRIFDVIR